MSRCGASRRSRGISPACTALDLPDPLGPTTAVKTAPWSIAARQCVRRVGPVRRTGWRPTRGRRAGPCTGSRPVAADGAGEAAGCDGSRSGILEQDLLLEAPQPRRRVDAELLGQDLAGGLEGAERVGLPARSVEREHLQGAELLAVRVLTREPLEVGHHSLRARRGRAGPCTAPRSPRAAAPRAAPPRPGATAGPGWSSNGRPRHRARAASSSATATSGSRSSRARASLTRSSSSSASRPSRSTRIA